MAQGSKEVCTHYAGPGWNQEGGSCIINGMSNKTPCTREIRDNYAKVIYYNDPDAQRLNPEFEDMAVAANAPEMANSQCPLVQKAAEALA